MTPGKTPVAALESKEWRLSRGRATPSHQHRKQFRHRREKFCILFKYYRNINSHELFTAARLVITLTNE